MSICKRLGFEAIQEYRGKGWRADVYLPNNGNPIAFEVQLSTQSLKRTLERQSKYISEGVVACWLFENPVSKLTEERPDLPIFNVFEFEDSNFMVNLLDRRIVDLQTFVKSFISNDIQFKSILKTDSRQLVELVFYEMDCWKCGELNYLYFVDSRFYSTCKAEIKPHEGLWDSSSVEFNPKIVELSKKILDTRKDLKLSTIKPRYSNTVEKSYVSFGCHKCDSIFGDFFVMEAKMEMIYEPKEIILKGEIELNDEIELGIPHWCFPENGTFCNNDEVPF
ncbi:competence protein CoiA family protein [Flavobacterium capsici]|uniref:Competence protein CoiA nuclease-like domain-containing protein n=1 Tax=Flavobacterium capsici TaxID=3075618 RepID=A0AA96J794_9FLAO|nr:MULTISPECIES: hypothetical protein [unclassified Flavobacterium]WNM18044.1 hypothetical protein RN608_08465 [Flavobacterium sp. PMR2A8]WNM22096.1 hypothetical protein RN605_01765 [Flavobacterium sp. PMTSA4]